jgi:CRISPR/Cas system-associated exonuclease Cas4 (RecB family)
MDRTARPGTPVPPREISATTLERYWNCPFGYLLEDIYGVEDQEIVPAPADPRAIGTLYHEVLQRIYADIRDTDEVIEPSHLGRYRERAREIVRAALDERVPALRDAAREAYLLLLDEIADFVLTHDAEAFPGYRVYGLEADYAFPAGTSAEAPVQGGLLRLTGRIDRILRSPETGAVVLADYKRKNIPGAGDIRRDLTDAAPDRPGSTDPERELHLQMPAYVYLLERNGLTVEAALYYGLERAKVGYVYHPTKRKPYLSREELDMLVDRIEARLRAMPERFAAGDFRVPNEDWGCASCRHRGVCRLRFNV